MKLSDEMVSDNDLHLTFKKDVYYCKKHGDFNNPGITIIRKNGSVTLYCEEGFAKLLDKFCCTVTKKE